jgi:hypothetical protein
VNSHSATVALVFAGVGHFFEHLLMLLWRAAPLVRLRYLSARRFFFGKYHLREGS